MFGSSKTDLVVYLNIGVHPFVLNFVAMCNVVMILVCMSSLRPISPLVTRYVGAQDRTFKLILVTGVPLCCFLFAFYHHVNGHPFMGKKWICMLRLRQLRPGRAFTVFGYSNQCYLGLLKLITLALLSVNALYVSIVASDWLRVGANELTLPSITLAAELWFQ